MFITITKHTATAVGREIREVTCEKCGTEFVYFVHARASGSGTSAFHLGGEGARNRASGEAKIKVRRQLSRLHLPVPCPECGWYQKYMVEILRFRRLCRWLMLAAVPLVWLLLKWCFTDAETPAQFRLVLWLSISAALVLAGIIFHLTWLDNLNPKSHIARDRTSGVAMRKADFEKLGKTQE